MAIALLVVCQRRRPSEFHENYKVWIGGRFCPQNWSFTYGQSSTNPVNFLKIGSRDVEIIGLTEINKIYLKNDSKTKALLAYASRRAGGLSNSHTYVQNINLE